YTQATDGGNTLYVINRIESIQENNKNEIVDELNSYVRLSEVSINTFLETDITGLVIKRKNLLMKNSPLPGSSQPLLASYNLPAPHLQDVLAAQTGTSAVEQEGGELALLNAEYQEALNNLVQYALQSDSAEIYFDAMVSILEQDTNLFARMQLIPIYIGQVMISEAQNAISLAEVQKNQLWSDEERKNIEERLQLAGLTIDIMQSGTNSDSVILANSAYLFAIAQADTTYNGIQAKLLLHSIGLIEYEPVVLLPVQESTAKLLELENITALDDLKIEEHGKPVFNVYPNPNDGSLWLEYDIEATGYVVIFDVSGVECARYELNPDERYKLIRNKNLEPGIYMYRIFCNEQIVHTGKYTVIKP
ncbi:MAG: T9SS type A sorting domain-containing protein, partial [Bacteroidia bacterium]|nr:T9SS type A sorting domain-containing protein [Bacteroidia bacterium]